MTCSTKSLKIFSLIFDIIYVLLTIIVVGIGIYIYFKFDHFQTSAYSVAGVGLIMLLVGLLGTLGAVKENYRLTKAFSIIIIILVVLQILAIAFFWLFETTFIINVDKTFDQLWRDQPTPIKPGNASQIASLERWLECCGNKGPTDYMLPPYSCYNKNDKLNLDGCRQKFIDYVAEKWTAFNLFWVLVIIVEVVCFGLATVLANSILNRWRRSSYYPK